jgi:hypothetical protein
MKSTTRAVWAHVLALTLLAAAAVRAADAPRRPLLMAGKQSLYERVLARPGAALRPSPEAGQPATEVVPFTAYYVYARRAVAGTQWLEVGTDSYGRVQGWAPASDLIDWKQALTVAFRDPVGHDRVLLFRDRDSLRDLVAGRDLDAYERLYRSAETSALPPSSPVIGIQPAGHLDLREDFYLVPIQAHEDIFIGGEKALMLQVTTVPLREGPRAEPQAEIRAAAAEAPQAPSAAPSKPAGFRAGLVFVIDATLSMGPYIDQTREVVRKVYDSLREADLTERVSFGLVAYRDDPRAVPGIEYLTRTYATLSQGVSPDSFFAQVESLRPSSVSTRAFREDSFAAVKAALDGMDWQAFQGRYIVLITDAGPRAGKDPLGSTGLEAEALRRLALDKGVSIWVLHLLTPEGEKLKDHASAASQYRRLSLYPGIGDFYYGVKMGDVLDYGRVLEALTSQIGTQVAAVEKVAAPEPERVAAVEPPPPAPAPAAEDPQLAALQAKVEKLGYALRMRYLEQRQGATVPAVFNAWLLDRDFRNPERATLDIRVLLTRDQLSDLYQVLRQVLDRAEEGLLSPRDFLDDLKSLAATLSRDPAKVGQVTQASGAANLADLGYLREYIEDLPYAGQTMDLSLDGWEDWPAARQLEFINTLENKLDYYRALHDHTDLWISLGGGPVTGDSVFPVPLEMLP